MALEFFFLGIEFVQHRDKLPDSANIQILFAAYDFMFALNFMLPVSLILAQIVCMILLVRRNELQAMHAMGYSRRQIMRPFIVLSFMITSIYVGLNATPFAYAKERVDSILDKRYFADAKENYFVKYEDYYVYFGKLYPLLSYASDVRVFQVRDRDMNRFIRAERAYFDKGGWQLLDATVFDKPREIDLAGEGIRVSTGQNLEILQGFRPKILDNIYETQGGLTIGDALDSWRLLSSQNVNNEKIRAILLSLLVFPFFAPLLGVVIVHYSPISQRYVNLSLVAFTGIFVTLVVWGLLYSLTRLSVSGLVIPEFSIMLPVFLLGIASAYLYNKT